MTKDLIAPTPAASMASHMYLIFFVLTFSQDIGIAAHPAHHKRRNHLTAAINETTIPLLLNTTANGTSINQFPPTSIVQATQPGTKGVRKPALPL